MVNVARLLIILFLILLCVKDLRRSWLK